MNYKTLSALTAFSLIALNLSVAAVNSSFSGDKAETLVNSWRGEHRIIDLHQHIDFTPEHLARAVKIMDRAGIGIGVNLSGGTTTHEEGKLSEFGRNRKL